MIPRLTLTLSLARLLARLPSPIIRTTHLPISPSRRQFLSLTVALILCTWWSKSGNSSTRAFCQTDYGTNAVSLAHSIMRPVSSLIPLSLCLRGCLF